MFFMHNKLVISLLEYDESLRSEFYQRQICNLEPHEHILEKGYLSKDFTKVENYKYYRCTRIL